MFVGRFSVCLAAWFTVVVACSVEPPVVVEPPEAPPVSGPPVGVSVAAPPPSTLPTLTTPSSVAAGGGPPSVTSEPPSGGGSAGEPPGGVPTSAVTTIPLDGGAEPGSGGIEPGSGEAGLGEGASESGGGESRGVFIDVSAGLGYSCGLREGGGVECWDVDWKGPLPNEWWERELRGWSFDLVDALPPAGVFTEVSAGWRNACGLRLSGRVECWGANRTAVVSPPSGVFSSVSVGLEHACGLRPGGRLECWGSSSRRRPASLPPGGVFLDFALSRSFGCGIRADHSLECWGPYYTHEVRTSEGLSPQGGVMPEGKFASLHAEGLHICGLRLEGSVECWGSGIDSARGRVTYLLPPSGEFASILGVNEYGRMACGRRLTGVVECWREGRDGEPDSWVVPAEREAVSPRDGRACDSDFMARRRVCLRSESGFGACGTVFTGRRICLKPGSEADSPEEITGIVSHGAFQYSFDVDDMYVNYDFERLCGLRPGGEVLCGYFGDVCEGTLEAKRGSCRLFGDLDYPEFLEHRWRESPSRRDNPPFPPAPAGVFDVLKAGLGFFCGLRPTGEVTCWGWEGSSLGLLSPPSGGFTKIDTSDRFACGLRPQGELECWGFGGGQSKIVPPNEEFADVHAGWGGLRVRVDSIYITEEDWGFSCGLLTGGRVDCWGTDPRFARSLEGEFTQIGAGQKEFCGLRPSGVIECWKSSPEFTPAGEARDAGGEGYVALSVGGESTCGLTQRGAVNCWTHNGSLAYRKEGPYTTVSAGYAHQCGVLATGDIHCWETRSANPANWEEITYPANKKT